MYTNMLCVMLIELGKRRLASACWRTKCAAYNNQKLHTCLTTHAHASVSAFVSVLYPVQATETALQIHVQPSLKGITAFA